MKLLIHKCPQPIANLLAGLAAITAVIAGCLLVGGLLAGFLWLVITALIWVHAKIGMSGLLWIAGTFLALKIVSSIGAVVLKEWDRP